MAKEISFGEFLKEGALKAEAVVETPVAVAEKPIRIEPDAPATDKELKQFWKQVRHFFRTGERPKEKNGTLVPALLAPYLKAGNYTNDYPIFISADGETCTPLVNLIQVAFEASFKAEEAKILRANLPRILRDFKEEVSSQKHVASFEKAWAKAEADLQLVDVHGDKQKLLLDDIATLKSALPNSGFVLRFSDEAPFVMLDVHLQQRAKNFAGFAKKVHLQIAALNERLTADANRKPSKESTKTETGYEFASELISLDKVGAMLPTEASVGLSENRKMRMQDAAERLAAGLTFFAKNTAEIIVTEALFDTFVWSEILPGANIIKAAVNQGYNLTESVFDDTIKEFAAFVAAERIAELELKDAYNEDVHDDFFAHFTWHRLTHQEMQLVTPVIFVGETQGFLRNNLARFSALVSLNKPIRLLAIEKRLLNAPNADVDWEDASHGYRQELAALAIAHRSAHTFQCAANQPVHMFKGIFSCLEVDSPSIMHFLIPDTGEVKITEILKLSAAVESRYFPSITYSLSEGKKWGSRFSISQNPQPEANWPTHPFTFVDVDGAEKTQEWAFTYADYKAISSDKLEELMIIPESFSSPELIPLADYLEKNAEELTGKVPFIWLVNQENCLKRAALPYMWVVSCQERLDNWNYIQELGGVNSYHVNEALAREKAKWQAEKAAEIASLNVANQAAIALAKSTAANEAMERLTNLLLGLDAAPAAAAAKPVATPKPAPAAAAPAKPEAKTAEPKAEAAPKQEKMEPYVDSFKCTSCNDCTEKFTTIFEYNQDKQAQVKANWKGTFENLVVAAEGCPAHCIHPGDPQNMKEPHIDELLKRAAKFN